jgi:type II restriction/modification system DNA methylase subunit YeeA
MNGIEIDEIAHDLASIVVWIGYIQWKQNNGYPHFDQPILEDLYHNIRLMDAILAYDAEGKPIEPEWQAVDVIVGNPPFLGGQRLRSELGNEYLEQIWHVYTDRIPGSADLVTYWFESARRQIEHHKAKRAGLLSTNSIRGGANRDVLKRIKDSGDIFMAWSDREWILEGAAVRVSMIGFDDGTEAEKSLDGLPVSTINADLTASIDITVAKKITQNQTLAFQGPVKVGAFDIPDSIARPMLQKANKNSEVIRPYMNGDDIVKHNRGYWLIDFGMRTEVESSAYHAPFSYVEKQVKPTRLKNKDRQRREYWWRLGRSGEDYKQAILGLKRQIFTPRVAKHRVYVWIDSNVMPSDALVAIARDDDYFFGVLHSRLHEVWSLRMGTWLGKGNDPRYTPTTTFETFPYVLDFDHASCVGHGPARAVHRAALHESGAVDETG